MSNLAKRLADGKGYGISVSLGFFGGIFFIGSMIAESAREIPEGTSLVVLIIVLLAVLLPTIGNIFGDIIIAEEEQRQAERAKIAREEEENFKKKFFVYPTPSPRRRGQNRR